jgi:hypothetical protein
VCLGKSPFATGFNSHRQGISAPRSSWESCSGSKFWRQSMLPLLHSPYHRPIHFISIKIVVFTNARWIIPRRSTLFCYQVWSSCSAFLLPGQAVNSVRGPNVGANRCSFYSPRHLTSTKSLLFTNAKGCHLGRALGISILCYQVRTLLDPVLPSGQASNVARVSITTPLH